ncbi:hypothetical protein ACI7BZ_19655 [Xanthobacter sp. AM11]|uniref:hypothetical protein n=1 Tax=Xanthobacter sp. AM11 TaxID=3380643 RepID=UPI0039BF065A
MARILAFLALFLALAGFTPWLIPVAKQGARLVAARDDPAAIADLGLADFTADAAQRAITAALGEDDAALAASYVELADARHIPLPAEMRAKVAVANGAAAQTLRSAQAFGLGFVTGAPNDLAGLAGAAASDLMVWGDIRDAGREGLKLARGEDADELILGLSAVGLAVTAGTYATVGASLPVRVGISLVKVAKRTGRLSAALARSLTRAVRESVDFAAVRRLAASPGAVDGAALKGVVRPDRLAGLTRMLDDAARIQAKAGTRAALEGLKVAEGGRDLSRVARLADAKGGQTLAILKTLGRGAIVITGALFHLIWWVLVAVAYTYGLVSSFNSFCVACARRTWRGSRRSRRHRGAARRWWMRREPAPVCAAPEPPDEDAGEAAAKRFAAAAEAARRLAQAPPAQGAAAAGPDRAAPGDGLAGRDGASSFPATLTVPPIQLPREGPSCPTSIQPASISLISTRAPATRSS